MRLAIQSAVLCALVFWVAACGQETFDPSVINEEYAGITTSDEEPLFGEEQLFASISATEADPAFADAVANDPAVKAQEEAALQVYYLFLAWGDLRGEMPASERQGLRPQDFSGSLALSDGAIVVVRTARMERFAGDGILPREAPQLVEWKSTILAGIDGMLVKLIAPAEAAVTVSVAGQTVVKNVADLHLAHGFVDVPGTSGALAWAAVRVEKVGGCAHGYLAGRWHRLAAQGGVFRGRWLAADGGLRGHMRGIFGTRRNGDNVLFGKWIGGAGEFRGLLAGQYEAGEFRGHWLDRNLGLHGRIRGVYFDPADNDGRSLGFSLGTWLEACGDEPIEPTETAVH